MAKGRTLGMRSPSTTGIALIGLLLGLISMGGGKVVHDQISAVDGSAIFFAGVGLVFAGFLLAALNYFLNPPRRR